MTVPNRFKSRQQIEKRLSVCLVLRRDRDFLFPIFCELFYNVTLDTGMFPNLRLSAACWFVMDDSYKNYELSFAVSLADCALPWAVIFFA